ncbi:MAG: glycosyltransferase family 2 protein [Acidobacteria bacterium]|nr:MAG: glycosyltransferase family 2 protein [Acidobacteriota bacterium]
MTAATVMPLRLRMLVFTIPSMPRAQPQAGEPLISIIVVNWNGLDLLDECFASLAKQTWKNKEFILVDNGSTDGSRELLISWAARLPNAQTILLPTNTGFCKANNIAFSRARGEWIALFNSDAVADPEWLNELVRNGDAANRIGMLASKILFQDPAGVIDKVGHLIYWDGQNRGRGTMETDVGQYDQPDEILWPDACAALYHRKVFEETGGFDESFFAFGDDADLGMRARLLGWSAWYVPSAVVHHRHSASFGVYSPLKVMLVERNRLLLAVKNFPWLLLLQNPFWTVRRLWWYAYAVLQRKGAAARFVETNGWRQTAFNFMWSYFSAMKLLPDALRKRQRIQRSKRVSDRELLQLLRRFQIDVRELTLRD